MKRQLLILCAIVLATASTATAQIIFNSNNLPTGIYQTNATVATGYVPTASTDAILLLGVATDGTLASPSATFGGNAMSLLASTGRTAIFGYVLTDTTPANLLVTTGVSNNETLITFGTLTGVDTSMFGSLKTANGAASVSNPTITLNSLNNLNATDYVFSVLAQNSAFNFSSSTPSAPLSSIHSFSGTFSGSYTSSIGGGVVGSAGNYTPSFTLNGAGSGFPVDTNSTFGSSVAFTAIPEPSTFAFLAGVIGGLILLRRRQS